jgi:glutathione S-transferase
MIIVHHLNNSRSQRILWLLEELDLKYEVKRYDRDPQTLLAPASLRQVHPLGKSPVISDGDLTLAESVRSSSISSIAMAQGGSYLLPVHRNDCATLTGCTTPKAQPCPRCCSS